MSRKSGNPIVPKDLRTRQDKINGSSPRSPLVASKSRHLGNVAFFKLKRLIMKERATTARCLIFRRAIKSIPKLKNIARS